jgi:hypothetical protein
VAYAGLHRIESAPRRHLAAGSLFVPSWLYHEAQLRDEWPGTGYDGTSGRGLCKALLEYGAITEYRFIETPDDLDYVLLNEGTVLVGVDWYTGMDNPAPSSHLITPTGAYRGGHEVLVDGVNVNQDHYRIHNSWGLSWGNNGRARIKRADLHQLLFEQFGDAIVVTETW